MRIHVAMRMCFNTVDVLTGVDGSLLGRKKGRCWSCAFAQPTHVARMAAEARRSHCSARRTSWTTTAGSSLQHLHASYPVEGETAKRVGMGGRRRRNSRSWWAEIRRLKERAGEETDASCPHAQPMSTRLAEGNVDVDDFGRCTYIRWC
jgi:hypothetical protein